jgi:hypothetical protein
MKKRIALYSLVIIFLAGGFQLVAQGITVSGILDSTVSLRLDDSPALNFGFEEYANLRFQSRIRDRAAVYGAVNLTAAAGDYAANAAMLAAARDSSPFSWTAYIGGENYIASIELERLYFRLNFEAANFDGGLLRLPFGYGLVWGPTDFLNPKNPLKPDARPRAILGAGLSYYPSDELKLLGFYAAPRNPFSGEGKGSRIGISMDRHSEKVSIQTLYSFETPDVNSDNGIHRAGFSVKADLQAGIVIETFYTYNHAAKTRLDGLSFSIGADYSLLDGNLIALAEYLYNGETSSTSPYYGGSLLDEHYLYTSVTWRFNDYTNINAALVSSFNDISFTPVVTLNHDLFQGAVLTVMLQIPLYSENKNGNLGFCSTRLRLRF